MTKLSLSKESKDFITKNIRSIEELDIFFLLRSNPDKHWDATAVSERLGIDPISASIHLMGLYLRGLILHNDSKGRLTDYRCGLHLASREKYILELQEALSKNRNEIIESVSVGGE